MHTCMFIVALVLRSRQDEGGGHVAQIVGIGGTLGQLGDKRPALGVDYYLLPRVHLQVCAALGRG